MPLTISYNRSAPKRLPNNEKAVVYFEKKQRISENIWRWPNNIFQTNKKPEEIISRSTIINNNVVKKNNVWTTKDIGKHHPSNSRKNTMCCWQVKTPTSFTSYENKKTFKIFDNLTCKRNVSMDCITNFNKSKEALQELQKRREKIEIRTLKIYNHTDWITN